MLGFHKKDECGAAGECFSEYIDGRLNDKERERLERHVHECESCRRELEGMKLTVDLVRQMPKAAAPRSFAISPRQISPARSISWAQPALRTATAAVAILLVLVVAGDFLNVAPFQSGQVTLQSRPSLEEPASNEAPKPDSQARSAAPAAPTAAAASGPASAGGAGAPAATPSLKAAPPAGQGAAREAAPKAPVAAPSPAPQPPASAAAPAVTAMPPVRQETKSSVPLFPFKPVEVGLLTLFLGLAAGTLISWRRSRR